MEKKICINLSDCPSAILAFDSIMNEINDPEFHLLALFRDYNYEFKCKYSSRMLNHYQSKGWVNAKRFNPTGKRRFSLFDMLFLLGNLEHYGVFEEQQLNTPQNFEVIKTNYENPVEVSSEIITPFELLCLITIVLYKQEYLELTFEKGDNLTIIYVNQVNRHFTCHLTRFIFNYLELFSLFINGYGKTKIMPKLEYDFFVLFTFYIDKIRDNLGVNLLVPELYSELKTKKTINISELHRNLVKQKLDLTFWKAISSTLLSDNKQIFKDSNGDCYEIEARYLGKEKFISKIYGEKVLSNIGDILNPI